MCISELLKEKLCFLSENEHSELGRKRQCIPLCPAASGLRRNRCLRLCECPFIAPQNALSRGLNQKGDVVGGEAASQRKRDEEKAGRSRAGHIRAVEEMRARSRGATGLLGGEKQRDALACASRRDTARGWGGTGGTLSSSVGPRTYLVSDISETDDILRRASFPAACPRHADGRPQNQHPAALTE